MKKKPKLTTLKNKAWKLFSEWIRRKDADAGGTTQCFTCNKLLDWKHEAQAGHAIGGRRNAVLFDEEIVRVQCACCNVILRGNYQIFIYKLIKKHGIEWWERKLIGATKAVKLTHADLEEMIAAYQAKLAQLGRPKEE